MNRRSRRAALALAMAGLLALESAVTWRLASRRFSRAGSAPALSQAPTPSDPMHSFRLERQQLRARQEAQLNDIIHDDSSDPQVVAQAQRQLMEELARAEQEAAIEGILQSRGFDDALASVSANTANVLVRGEALTQRETAVILDLVMRETGLTGGNVKIIPVK